MIRYLVQIDPKNIDKICMNRSDISQPKEQECICGINLVNLY